MKRPLNDSGSPTVFLCFLMSLLFGFATASANAQQQATRSYTVADMLETGGIGEVRFNPQGTQVILERLDPYEETNHPSAYLLSKDRARLFYTGIADQTDVRPLLHDELGNAMYGEYSPNGDKLAVYWLEGETVRAGVYDFAKDSLKKFMFFPYPGHALNKYPLWVSNTELVYPVLDSMEDQLKHVSKSRATTAQVTALEDQSWRGQTPAVTVLTSDKTASDIVGLFSAPPYRLVKVNVQTGAVLELAAGFHMTLFNESPISADRRYMVVTRKTGVLPLDQWNKDDVSAIGNMRFVLVLLDLSGATTEKLICSNCSNIVPGSARWSGNGTRLLFSSVEGQDATGVRYFVYSIADDKLDAVQPEGLKLKSAATSNKSGFRSPLGWMGDTLIALAKPEDGQDGDRYDWYAIPAAASPGATAPINLTFELEDSPTGYLTSRNGKLLLISGGNLWRVGINAKAENLTQMVTEEVSAWCTTFSTWRRERSPCDALNTNNARLWLDEAALTKGVLALQMFVDNTSTGVMFFNLDTGAVLTLNKPQPDDVLLAASALGQAAVYQRQGADGDRLVLATAAGPIREIAHYNQHLKGLAPQRKVMLSHKGDDDEDMVDWLLLPANHHEGEQYPLVVYFYPDIQYSEDWSGDDLRYASFLNQNLLTGQGYAVLLASMKISPMGEPGEPMHEMHDQLIRAAENAVESGYADPERWAVIGHSYGGYGTASILTQTNRFKAAVAISGSYNLTSTYGVMSPDQRTLPKAEIPYGAGWSKTQGRMVKPPWQDSGRYVRNSPLLHAGNINTPLLLVHGDRDFAVNVTESEQMFNALLIQGKDAKFLRYWGEGHLINSPANIQHMWDQIFSWLEEYMK